MTYRSPQTKPGTMRTRSSNPIPKTGRGDGHRSGNPIAGSGKEVLSTHTKSSKSSNGGAKSGQGSSTGRGQNPRGYSRSSAGSQSTTNASAGRVKNV